MSNQHATQVTVKAERGETTHFEVTGRDDRAAGNFGTALERNRAFAAVGGHEGVVVFPKLRLLVITCMDPRVDPAHFLGLQPSEAVVVRNGGGRVTPEVINDVAFIGQIAENVIPDGPLFEVAVIHHTQCGSGALADETFRRKFAGRIGADETELSDYAVLDPVATVTSDVELLLTAPAIPARVSVSGHVYDIVNGLVQTVVRSAYPAGNRQTAVRSGSSAQLLTTE